MEEFPLFYGTHPLALIYPALIRADTDFNPPILLAFDVCHSKGPAISTM
jgi:hypothetical protein